MHALLVELCNVLGINVGKAYPKYPIHNGKIKNGVYNFIIYPTIYKSCLFDYSP